MRLSMLGRGSPIVDCAIAFQEESTMLSSEEDSLEERLTRTVPRAHDSWPSSSTSLYIVLQAWSHITTTCSQSIIAKISSITDDILRTACSHVPSA